jgi:hypothetical protein
MNMQIHTGRVGYAEPLCGHAKNCLLLFLCGSVYEGISKFGIEVKAVSDECLAKSVAGT